MIKQQINSNMLKLTANFRTQNFIIYKEDIIAKCIFNLNLQAFLL
jgi:hypothetical protein